MDTRVLQLADGFGGGVLDGVGDGDETGESSCERDVHDRLSVLLQGFGLRLQRGGRGPKARHEGGVADGHLPALHRAGEALAGERLKAFDGKQRNLPVLRGSENRGCERVFAGLLQARRGLQQLGVRDALRRNQLGQHGFAERQRSGLVHDEGVDLLH